VPVSPPRVRSPEAGPGELPTPEPIEPSEVGLRAARSGSRNKGPCFSFLSFGPLLWIPLCDRRGPALRGRLANRQALRLLRRSGGRRLSGAGLDRMLPRAGKGAGLRALRAHRGRIAAVLAERSASATPSTSRAQTVRDAAPATACRRLPDRGHRGQHRAPLRLGAHLIAPPCVRPTKRLLGPLSTPSARRFGEKAKAMHSSVWWAR
jgi:hypothetical protein